MIQSSTAHTLPYPAYLYGKGTWAAIDILFFMPDIPITFMGELQGDIFKVGAQGTVFQQDQSDIAAGNPNELKRTNSQIMKALQSDTESTTTAATSNSANPE